jgi:hypothetical protein
VLRTTDSCRAVAPLRLGQARAHNSVPMPAVAELRLYNWSQELINCVARRRSAQIWLGRHQQQCALRLNAFRSSRLSNDLVL